MSKRIVCRALSLALALSWTLAGRASAQQDSISFIRDAEIESTIRTYATPLFSAAGLDASAVHIYIVNDNQLNAFVAGGQNLFINTGTLLRSDSPNQLVGVMAHETGHIAGGHLARIQDALRHATAESIVAMVLGAAAAAAAGNAGAGAAAILGGQEVGLRSILAYSVTQEASADAAGMTFLDRTGQSARGLLQFFQILEGMELTSAHGQPPPYLRSHPLTSERIENVKQHVLHSKFSNAPDPPDWIEMHRRMKAKLAGFLQSPARTVEQYPPSDNSVAARYARAVAYYRVPDLAHAVPIIDGLIRDYPRDPYFQELKGQMLFENGKIQDAVPAYDQAVKLHPDSALLRIELAQSQIETNDPALNLKALANLNDAVRTEEDNAEAWRLLAIAYGRTNNIGMAALALAEQGMAQGDKTQAKQQAMRAVQLLPPGPAKLRAEDIQHEAESKE